MSKEAVINFHHNSLPQQLAKASVDRAMLMSALKVALEIGLDQPHAQAIIKATYNTVLNTAVVDVPETDNDDAWREAEEREGHLQDLELME